MSYLSEASVSGQVLNGNRYDLVAESKPDEAPPPALHRPDLFMQDKIRNPSIAKITSSFQVSVKQETKQNETMATHKFVYY